MSQPVVRLAMRPWDHLTPLLTGELTPASFDLRIEVVEPTPDVVNRDDVDGGEVSFSRYILACGLGDDRLIGLPVFVMRGFRHRSIVVHRDSGLTAFTDLSGARVGVTGWHESGLTWTRAALRRNGIDLARITWELGSLTPGGAPAGGLPGGSSPPGNVVSSRPGDSLVAALHAGAIDALATPFLPPGFHRNGWMRHLIVDYPKAEREYFSAVRYVPGIHLVALKRSLVQKCPWLVSELTAVLAESKRRWHETRLRYADTTPWLLAEMEGAAASMGLDWMPYGLDPNRRMISDFCAELYSQGISGQLIDGTDFFDEYLAQC